MLPITATQFAQPQFGAEAGSVLRDGRCGHDYPDRVTPATAAGSARVYWPSAECLRFQPTAAAKNIFRFWESSPSHWARTSSCAAAPVCGLAICRVYSSISFRSTFTADRVPARHLDFCQPDSSFAAEQIAAFKAQPLLVQKRMHPVIGARVPRPSKPQVWVVIRVSG
jgi:hypothetical protein